MGRKLIDLTGQKFNKLTVLRTFKKFARNRFVSISECLCDCGNKIVVESGNLKTDNAKSCGCLKNDQLINLTGKIFGRLTALKRIGGNANKRGRWLCQCTCGNRPKVVTDALVNNRTQSCGCFKMDKLKQGIYRYKHGKRDHYLYGIWSRLRQRCYNPNDPRFHLYGGRENNPISVFPEWNTSFESFYNYIIGTLGERPTKDHSLDRQNNDRNYEPGNLRWATDKEQARNRSKNLYLTYKGITLLILEWAEKIGLSYNVIFARYSRNWTIAAIITTPCRKSDGRILYPKLDWLTEYSQHGP